MRAVLFEDPAGKNYDRLFFIKAAYLFGIHLSYPIDLGIGRYGQRK